MWPNPIFPADLVTFTEEIVNGKLYLFFTEKGEKWISRNATCSMIILYNLNREAIQNTHSHMI